MRNDPNPRQLPPCNCGHLWVKHSVDDVCCEEGCKCQKFDIHEFAYVDEDMHRVGRFADE